MQRVSLPLILGVSLFVTGLVACGDDGSGDSSSGETGDGDGDPTTGDGDGDPTTGDGDGDPTTGDGDGDPTTGDGDGDPGNCQVWEIVYDMTGSEFEIAGTPFGAGDQINTVMMPYDADDHVGPGQFVLRFSDVDGNPGGQAFMHEYDMTINFVVDGATTVTTDLQATAGPTECGITSGSLAGTDLDWSPSAIVDLHTMGTILCQGNLCGLGGLPNGMAVPQDETSDMPLSTFEFNGDLSQFEMAQTVIQMDNQSTTSWMYMGAEVSRELIDAADCYCE